ncbi:hypothetical protein C8F01DRAFT_1268950 [Mycena amicta]|nr:hypothetical protein C8F01DRAFT_1268950 [Mycena amicta]
MDALSPGMPASVAPAVHRPVLSRDEPAVAGFERATFMTRERLHSPGPVDVVLEDDQPNQVIHAAVGNEWLQYLEREPLHVRPSLLTSAQTMYHGVNVDENGQKTHQFTSLNASRILYNPTNGQPSMVSGHAFTHFVEAPEGGAFWSLELPYPRDERIEVSMSPVVPRSTPSTTVILKEDGSSSPRIPIPPVFDDSIPVSDLGNEANEGDAEQNNIARSDEIPTTTELVLGRDGSPLTTLSSGSEEYELVGSHAPNDDEDVCSECGREGHKILACDNWRPRLEPAEFPTHDDRLDIPPSASQDAPAGENTPSSGPAWLELFSRNVSPEPPEFQGIVATGFPENVVRMGGREEHLEAKHGQDDDARAEMSAQLLAEDMDHGAKVMRAYLMHRTDGPEDVSTEINALTAANVSCQRLLSAFSSEAISRERLLGIMALAGNIQMEAHYARRQVEETLREHSERLVEGINTDVPSTSALLATGAQLLARTLRTGREGLDLLGEATAEEAEGYRRVNERDATSRGDGNHVTVTSFPPATSHSLFRPQDSSPLRADFGSPSDGDELVSLPDVVVLGDDELVTGDLQSDPALSYDYPIHQQRATVDTEQDSQTSNDSTSSSLPDLISVSSTGSSSSWGSVEYDFNTDTPRTVIDEALFRLTRSSAVAQRWAMPEVTPPRSPVYHSPLYIPEIPLVQGIGTSGNDGPSVFTPSPSPTWIDGPAVAAASVPSLSSPGEPTARSLPLYHFHEPPPPVPDTTISGRRAFTPSSSPTWIDGPVVTAAPVLSSSPPGEPTALPFYHFHVPPPPVPDTTIPISNHPVGQAVHEASASVSTPAAPTSTTVRTDSYYATHVELPSAPFSRNPRLLRQQLDKLVFKSPDAFPEEPSNAELDQKIFQWASDRQAKSTELGTITQDYVLGPSAGTRNLTLPQLAQHYNQSQQNRDMEEETYQYKQRVMTAQYPLPTTSSFSEAAPKRRRATSLPPTPTRGKQSLSDLGNVETLQALALLREGILDTLRNAVDFLVNMGANFMYGRQLYIEAQPGWLALVGTEWHLLYEGTRRRHPLLRDLETAQLYIVAVLLRHHARYDLAIGCEALLRMRLDNEEIIHIILDLGYFNNSGNYTSPHSVPELNETLPPWARPPYALPLFEDVSDGYSSDGEPPAKRAHMDTIGEPVPTEIASSSQVNDQTSFPIDDQPPILVNDQLFFRADDQPSFRDNSLQPLYDAHVAATYAFFDSGTHTQEYSDDFFTSNGHHVYQPEATAAVSLNDYTAAPILSGDPVFLTYPYGTHSLVAASDVANPIAAYIDSPTSAHTTIPVSATRSTLDDDQRTSSSTPSTATSSESDDIWHGNAMGFNEADFDWDASVSDFVATIGEERF